MDNKETLANAIENLQENSIWHDDDTQRDINLACNAARLAMEHLNLECPASRMELLRLPKNERSISGNVKKQNKEYAIIQR